MPDFLNTNPIPDEYVRETCKPGQGEGTCRFLTMAPWGWSCAKFTELAGLINKRVADKLMNASGDNCEGRTP